MLAAMMRRFLALALFAAMLAVAPQARAQAQGRTAAAPVLVELYTSQGCFSCPRANRLLGELSRDPGILALTFPVGYWDYLGWSDTFAQPEFTSRQRDYARTLRFRGPYTPQLIIGGVRQVSASDWDESRAALQEVQAEPAPAAENPTLSITRVDGGRVRVNIGSRPGHSGAADIWLVAYDPGPLTVFITTGENANRNVTHYNVVRRVTRVGAWSGAALWFERSRCSPQCAVIVQAPRGGRVFAVAATRRAND
ncbi:MAG: DUF1223 domain-containing protein [Terricaulis sp.]